ncbi:MAG: PIN domain-containing protein [Flavobacteriales bacterium]|jgi:predicted nucleic acid-binding protein|nr:PIN domain-containing protein [Flavobacteriales bacterium]MBK6550400.1 PIN domain-containing protein [Flavobacteriales bacterium]MBK6881435.1 PIN domain-containing protein [Flavobacteriales bacterium]MBK7102752.1 PIN domain-containing protein [Flavobacteriales bacterium]MBK7113642.1 PIN domain-containing protein [Flavobacteriales bacterium]
MRVLIDSDVVIAAMAGSEDQSEASQVVMDALADGRFTGCTTPVLMANIMFVISNKWRLGRRTPDRARVVKAMNSLLPMFTMIPIGHADFYASFASEFGDLEDGVQHFAALHATGVDAIVTCNTKDFGPSQIPVLDPSKFAADHLDL